MSENNMEQKFYTAEESALMFAAACDKIATECVGREDLSVEERVKLAVRGVLLLIDDGCIEVGVPMMCLTPQLEDTVNILDDGPVDFRIPNKDVDIAGNLHEFALSEECIADGNKLLEEFGTNLGARMVKFGLTTEDTFHA